MKSAEAFEAHLASELLPRVARLEAERDDALRKLMDLGPTLKRAALVLGASYVVSALIHNGLPFLLAFSGLFIWEALRRLRSGFVDWDRRRKLALVKEIIEYWDPSFQYLPHASITREEFVGSGLWHEAFDYYGGEDRVAGRVGDTTFRFSEVRLSKQGRENRVIQVFRGLVFVADFNKAFKGRLLVLPDGLEKHLGFVGRAMQRLETRFGKRLMELEDPEFERTFAVYGDDPIEARYLLSPGLMRRLLRLRQQVGGPLRVGLQHGLLTLIVPMERDLFSLPPAAMREEDLRRMVGELLFVTGLIEDLDLNTRIWSKAPAA